jgi:hypothetical protein
MFAKRIVVKSTFQDWLETSPILFLIKESANLLLDYTDVGVMVLIVGKYFYVTIQL